MLWHAGDMMETYYIIAVEFSCFHAHAQHADQTPDRSEPPHPWAARFSDFLDTERVGISAA